jgi:hypothetical protein
MIRPDFHENGTTRKSTGSNRVISSQQDSPSFGAGGWVSGWRRLRFFGLPCIVAIRTIVVKFRGESLVDDTIGNLKAHLHIYTGWRRQSLSDVISRSHLPSCLHCDITVTHVYVECSNATSHVRISTLGRVELQRHLSLIKSWKKTLSRRM